MSNPQNPPGNLPPAAAAVARAAGATICQSGLPSPDLLRPALRGLKLNDTQWAAIYEAPVFSDQQRSALQNASKEIKDAASNVTKNLDWIDRIAAQSQAVGAIQREHDLRRNIIGGLSDEQLGELAVFVRGQFQPGGPLAMNRSERAAFNKEMDSFNNPRFRESIGQAAVDAAAIGARLMGMNTLDRYMGSANNCSQPSPPSGRTR